MKHSFVFVCLFLAGSGYLFAQVSSEQGTAITNISRDAQVVKIAQPDDIWITASQSDWKSLSYWEFEITGEPTANIGYQLLISETGGGPQYLLIRNRNVAWKAAVNDSYQSRYWSNSGAGACAGTARLSGAAPGGPSVGTYYFRIGCQIRVATGVRGGVSTSITGVCNITSYSM